MKRNMFKLAFFSGSRAFRASFAKFPQPQFSSTTTTTKGENPQDDQYEYRLCDLTGFVTKWPKYQPHTQNPDVNVHDKSSKNDAKDDAKDESRTFQVGM